MTQSKTKRALLLSVLSVIMCMAMLIGTTYAWFTDSDTVSVNKIVAGTLDIEIVDEDGNPIATALNFVNKDGSANILWEPGATFATTPFAIKNNGDLWLKFKVQVNNTEVSYNALNEVISFSLVDADGKAVDLATMKDVALEPTKTTGYYTIVGTMSKDADKKYMGMTLDGISITVFATQLNKEADYAGTDYDIDAPYEDQMKLVMNADEFVKAFNEIKGGETIVLGADIDMTGVAWTPVMNKGFELDGANFTVTGLSNALVAHTGSASYDIHDVTFDKMSVTNALVGTQSYAGLIGDADTCSYINMENVTISNSTFVSDLIDGANDGKGYAGAFVAYTSGYNADNNGPVNASHNFTNCKLINTTVTGTSSAGGLIGHCGGNSATTTVINGFSMDADCSVVGEKSSKTGLIIGTSHIGKVDITYDAAEIKVAGNIVGRFVPVTTGKLTINGAEQTEFAN